jgi:hypothetical protein
MKENGELPPWVLDRVNQSAQLMGMAVSYVSFQQEKKLGRVGKKVKRAGKKKAKKNTTTADEKRKKT